MLTAAPALALPLLASPLATAQFDADADVRFHLLFGLSDLDADFAPADEHTVVGIGITVRDKYSVLGFEAAYGYSWGEGHEGGVRIDSEIHEFTAGARWTFEPFGPALLPYVSLGGAVSFANQDIEGEGGESDYAFGIYARAGLRLEFGEGWSVGVDVRALEAEGAKLQTTLGMDQVQAALTVGWAW